MVRGFEIVKPEFRKQPTTDFIQLPSRATQGSAGYDFFSPQSIVIMPQEQVIIATDIRAFMMPDEVLKCYPRSSMGIKHQIMISNIVPIIDSDYFDNPSTGGNIMFALYNFGHKPFHLARGEHFAQGIFQKFLTVTDDTPRLQRRIGGIGSTGEIGLG